MFTFSSISPVFRHTTFVSRLKTDEILCLRNMLNKFQPQYFILTNIRVIAEQVSLSFIGNSPLLIPDGKFNKVLEMANLTTSDS